MVGKGESRRGNAYKLFKAHVCRVSIHLELQHILLLMFLNSLFFINKCKSVLPPYMCTMCIQ